MLKTKSGFTIVELLIVIVVIGVLAAITIVAYNGIQDRARNSALKSEMSQLQKKIQVEALQYDGESISLKAPLAYGLGTGSWKLSEPLQSTQQITLYGVFATNNNMSSSWGSIVLATPATATNYLSLRAVDAGNSGVQGLWQTSAQTNKSVGSTSGIRNTTGRHVGWLTVNGSAIYAGFDNGAGGSESAAAHNGWTFDGVTAFNTTGVGAIAVLVFPEYHDTPTRTQVLKWLDREHGIDYYS